MTLKSLNSKSRVSSKWPRNVAVKFDVVFYTLKPANNAIAGNSDEVIYPTPIPAKISGVPFGVDPRCWGLH